jgi:predicted nuclease of predicted toxin-antitoxin system
LNPEKPRLRFLLDEGVTLAAGKALEEAGHEVIFFQNSGLAKGSADTIVCITAEKNDAVLVSHDRDMKTLVAGHGVTPARYKALSLIQLKCRESEDADRIRAAISLVEHEWKQGEGRERRLHVVIDSTIIRTHR